MSFSDKSVTIFGRCHFSVQLRVEYNRFYTVLSWKLKHRKNNRFYASRDLMKFISVTLTCEINHFKIKNKFITISNQTLQMLFIENIYPCKIVQQILRFWKEPQKMITIAASTAGD